MSGGILEPFGGEVGWGRDIFVLDEPLIKFDVPTHDMKIYLLQHILKL